MYVRDIKGEMSRAANRMTSSWKRAMAMSCLLVIFTGVPAKANIAPLLEEPYGRFGHMNPTGHAAVYFNHICATTPTELRPCKPGEPGVVISRYHRVAGYDWVAIPLIPYLYSVEHLSAIPAEATPALEARLRDSYRRHFLEEMIPDGPGGAMPEGDWTQLVGASYDRKIFGLSLKTTPEQDAAFIAIYNDRSNAGHFNLVYRNCADFTRTVVNMFFPHAVHRSIFGDLGVTTPKHVAQQIVKYGRKHPELEMEPFVIPQVPGTIERSRKVDGVSESLVKSKKYVVPLTIIAPEVTAAVAVDYVTRDRFTFPKDAPVLNGPDLVKAQTTGANAPVAPTGAPPQATPAVIVAPAVPADTPGAVPVDPKTKTATVVGVPPAK